MLTSSFLPLASSGPIGYVVPGVMRHGSLRHTPQLAGGDERIRVDHSPAWPHK